ncbi:hypothetical protein F5146DRAFT_996770 [Armillaria mellea]|nr:hypothetical protein F5146DRAFT_996770 [Armillaria mellea]
MPFPSKMYFAMLALLMLAVAHAAPLDPVLPRDILANTQPSNIERRPATKRHNIPPFSGASSPSGTKTTRSMPMAMQARAPEIILHSRTEEIRGSTIDRDESRRGWASSSPSVRGYNGQRSLSGEEKSTSRAGALYPRAQDHSSDKSTYQHISSISSRQLRAPDYDSAGNQSNSTTEENGSHPTTYEEQKQSTEGEEQKGSSFDQR